MDGFHGAWTHVQKARVGVCVSAAVLKVQAIKHCIESLTISAEI